MKHAATVSVLVVLLVACGGDVEPNVTATAGSGGQSCQSTQGSLDGDIFQMGADEPQAGALALLRQMADDTPLQVQADANGHYQVMLEAGAWLVDGEDGPYCATTASTPVTVEACGEHTIDLQLECVLGGG